MAVQNFLAQSFSLRSGGVFLNVQVLGNRVKVGGIGFQSLFGYAFDFPGSEKVLEGFFHRGGLIHFDFLHFPVPLIQDFLVKNQAHKQAEKILFCGALQTTEKPLKPCGFNGFLHPLGMFGGDKRDRTADLLNAIQALSQLSYTPEYFALSLSARDILPETSGFVNTILKIFCFFLEPGRWSQEGAAPGRRGGPPRRVAPERALAL